MKRTLCFVLALAMLLALAACGGTRRVAPGADSAAAGQSGVTGSYTFEEAAMGGQFTVLWILELREDGTYTITEDNPVMGINTYEGEYAVDGDVISTGPFEGDPPVATFFAADKSCRWRLEGSTCVPVNYDADAVPNLGGLPGTTSDAAEGVSDDLSGLSYASNSAAQICDIYLPEGVEKAPVIVLVHGGGFMFGDQGMAIIQPVISAALANGYAVVSVDYRKSSEVVFPAALADVKAAVRFVRANAEDYGFDDEHIAVWGESAGAYLSLMTALTPGVEELNGDVTDYAGISSAVNALVSFYAPVEFYTLYEEAGKPDAAAGSFESKFVGQDITADKAVTYATYWETYADQLPDGLKAWIQAGDSDQRVPYTQSGNFASRLTEYLGEENVEFNLIAGADHEDEAFYTEENLAAVFAWLSAIMR